MEPARRHGRQFAAATRAARPCLQRAWRADLGEGSNNRVQIAAPPVIADGRALLPRRRSSRARRERQQRRPHLERTRCGRTRRRDRVARGGGVAVARRARVCDDGLRLYRRARRGKRRRSLARRRRTRRSTPRRRLRADASMRSPTTANCSRSMPAQARWRGTTRPSPSRRAFFPRRAWPSTAKRLSRRSPRAKSWRCWRANGRRLWVGLALALRPPHLALGDQRHRRPSRDR